MSDFRQQIQNYLKDSSNRPLKIRALADALDIPDQVYGQFRRTLRELVREGSLLRLEGGHYASAEKTETVAGRLSVTRGGNGFLSSDAGGPDVYVQAMNLGTALHGDRVNVELSGRPRRSGSPEGRVVAVLERGSASMIGTYQRRGHTGYVAPDDSRITWEMTIPESDRLGAQKGQKVVAQIDKQESPHGNLTGRILEVLGNPDDPGVDVLSILKAYNLPTEFLQEVTEDAQRAPETIPESEIDRREDFRNELVLTIDPEDAKDFDDAVSIKLLENGHTLLGVHIADVSFYVREQSALDGEARARGTSVYLVDRVIPMLPERLSSEICSLKPDEDRLTMSAVMELSAEGEVVTYRIVDSIIHSGGRLTYEQAMAMLDGEGEGPIPDALRQMDRLSKILIKRRTKRGSIDFDLPEPEVTLDERGVPIDIQRTARLDSHRLVESFMLLANETVASHLTGLRKPALYRVHESPDPEKLEAFSQFVQALGYAFRAKEATSPKYLRDFLSQVEGHREEPLVHELLLRSMKRAVYSPENIGHFGLACPLYTHFTSPIRRYPDLIVHRILRETFSQKDVSSEREARWKEALPEIGAWISERERIAVEAERASVKVKQTTFMEDKIGEQFWGIISGVTKFGVFVELEDFLVDGLVHISSLTDDYYELDEAQYALIGTRTARRLRMGDRVQIQVVRADRQLRQVDF
ncbi:MAG: ribonuclease R, partial [Candidatus Latescibacterota bacterium]